MAEQVKVGSLCALGGTAPNPVFTALKYFRDEFEEHVVDKKCRAGICTALVTYSIDPETCTGCRACVAGLPDRRHHRREARKSTCSIKSSASSAAPATRNAASTL